MWDTGILHTDLDLVIEPRTSHSVMSWFASRTDFLDN